MGTLALAQEGQKMDTLLYAVDSLEQQWIMRQQSRQRFMSCRLPLDRTNDDADTLLLSIRKPNSDDFPQLLSIKLPASIDQSKGLYMYFGKEEVNDLNEEELLLTDDPILLNYNMVLDEYYEVRIVNTEVEDQEIVLQKLLGMFLQYDVAFFIIAYPNDEVVSAKLLLTDFKSAFEKLINNKPQK